MRKLLYVLFVLSFLLACFQLYNRRRFTLHLYSVSDNREANGYHLSPSAIEVASTSNEPKMQGNSTVNETISGDSKNQVNSTHYHFVRKWQPHSHHHTRIRPRRRRQPKFSFSMSNSKNVQNMTEATCIISLAKEKKIHMHNVNITPMLVKEEEQEKKCEKYNFPWNKRSRIIPSDCWPRLVILPSFPTSGNGIVRMLWSLSTGLMTGSSAGSNRLFRWNLDNIFYASIDGTVFKESVCPQIDRLLTVPHSDRVALQKSHSEPAQWKVTPSYILQIVRNPGDHLIRNMHRWKTKNNRNEGTLEEFIHTVNSTQECPIIVAKKSHKWVDFYQKWTLEAETENISLSVINYEHITNPEDAESKMRDVIDFVEERQVYDVNYTAVLKVPSYSHGALFRDACGLEMARQLHEVTQHVSEAFGYIFDYTEGIWTIPRYKVG